MSKRPHSFAKSPSIRKEQNFPQQLDTLWQRYLQDKPAALDRWFGKERLAGMEVKRWLSLNEGIMMAVRFQQLAMLLEVLIQHPNLDIERFDRDFSSAQLEKISAPFFWHWLELRTQNQWGFGRDIKQQEKRLAFFEKIRDQAQAQPLSPLGMIWHGLRPQWLPKLQERATQSQWSQADLGRFIQGQNNTPPLWLRVNPLLQDDSTDALKNLQQQLLDGGINCQLRQNHLYAMGGKGVQGHELYRTGKIEIQDLASQQAAFALQVQPGDKVWDACAGAGGKSLALASKLNNKGALVATDLHEFKLTELKKRASRASVRNIRTFAWQGEETLRLPQEIARQGGFDKILLDVPCTASGTWRRNADARWNFNPDSLDELLALQQRLLRLAAQSLRPGGTLAYVTCSWLKSENEDQVAHFVQESGFTLLEQKMLGAPLQDSDTLFVALLRKA